jgi:ferredoxin
MRIPQAQTQNSFLTLDAQSFCQHPAKGAPPGPVLENSAKIAHKLMKAKWVTYFSHALLHNNEPSTQDEFRASIVPFARDRLVYLTAAISSMLQSWKGDAPDLTAHTAIVSSIFPADQAAKLIAGSKSAEPHFVFHREQLLFVAKEAIFHCPEQGIDPLTHLKDLGAMFLMANDHLYTPFPAPKNEEEMLLTRMAQLIPSSEYSGRISFRNRIGRSYLMTTKFLEELKGDADFLDVRQLFEEVVKLTPVEFEALCFATTFRYLQSDFGAFNKDPSIFLLPQAFFVNTGMTQPQLERFRREVSGRGKALKKAYEKRTRGNSDFILFRDKPMFYTEDDHLFCADTGFLIEKLDSGPFWRVHNALKSDAEKEQLHRFWGKSFERYIGWMISEYSDGKKNIYIPSPKYKDGDEEVCDGIVVCGTTAVFLEVKGSTFTAQSKYGLDLATLSKELEDKLIQNQAGKSKGVAQLGDAIQKVFSRVKPAKVVEIDLSTIQKVIPVLIVRDGIGNVMMLNALLNLKFQSVFNRKNVWPHTVTPLCVLSADAFDFLAPYLGEFEFAEIVESRLKGDKSLKGGFLIVENSTLDKAKARENDRLEKAFAEFTNNIISRLFPTETINVP